MTVLIARPNSSVDRLVRGKRGFRGSWPWALARLLVGFVALAPACRTPPPAPPPTVVLLVLDTVRADHLSCYGYERETTPNLDRLAAEGERYADAWSQAPWTLPSMATILTGQPPHAHGAGRSSRGMHAVNSQVTSLAEELAARGFATAAFINVVWCHPRSGLARGFDRYDFHSSDESNRNQRDAAQTTEAAITWAEAQRERPLFLVVHYFDPHLTYDPPPPYDTLFEPDELGRLPEGFGSADEIFAVREGRLTLDARQRISLIARHDGELRWADEQFGRLRAGLERIGRWDRALVVVTADHGEEFWEHGGFEHGHSHHRELLHIPLIVRRPGGGAGSVKPGRARHLDIAPTVLDELGIPRPASWPGQPLGGAGARWAVAEGSLWAGDLVSVRGDAGTVILDRGTGESRFFTPEDRGELLPLPVDDGTARELLELLRALPTVEEGRSVDWQPDEEQLRQLRSLGYVR